jgi:dihydrofolate synthase/folylpolyglutamate synthase
MMESVEIQLHGPYQNRNVPGVMAVLDLIATMGFPVELEHIKQGFSRVVDLTGIRGRWQVLGSKPTIICDTGHNRPAMEITVSELKILNRGQLHMVLGFVRDKDIRAMLEILPKDARYYFCAAPLPRSLDAQELASLAEKYQLYGLVIADPNQALETARKAADKNDLIFVGGSTFVVAELALLN